MIDLGDVQRQLQEFNANPRAAMQKIPEKRDQSGQTLTQAPTLFGDDAIEDRRFVSHKDTVRQTFHTVVDGVTLSLSEVLPGRAPIAQNDRPESLVDDFRYRTLEDIERAGLRSASLPESPWSDDYWAIYRGLLGCRYADPDFPSDADWKSNFDYVERRPMNDIVASGDSAAIDRLSPSEKYDLLVGNSDAAMTTAMWLEGKRYFDATGTVETWMGICHGWAPAAYCLPRPHQVITATTVDGRQLRFYPSDVKALASLLWANASPDARFIGTRANETDPEVDEVGRVISSAVFDTNPGAWHLAVVNQLAGRRSFVMDATYDYQVWNQPVFSYEYLYFNPQEAQQPSELADAIVRRESFTNDKFARYRSPEAAAVVGVVMRVGYVVETRPSHATSDSPENDQLTYVDYLYDLELDAGGAVIGGEWWQNPHPDFLWTPPPRARATTPADQFATGEWTVSQPLPRRWAEAARRESANQRPLAKIVETLIEAANG